MRVEQLMTKDVQSCRPDDSLADAERTMREGKIRRLPVGDTLAAICEPRVRPLAA